jgi:hypothetical protein
LRENQAGFDLKEGEKNGEGLYREMGEGDDVE